MKLAFGIKSPSTLFGAIAALIMAGCHHAAPVRSTGNSTFSFLESPAPPGEARPADPHEVRQPVDAVAPAEPKTPLANPVYPPSALGRVQIPVVIGVRMVVDASGRVTETGPSLRVFSTPSPFDDAFRAAVEAAVSQWRFTPAEKRHLIPGSGGRVARTIGWSRGRKKPTTRWMSPSRSRPPAT